MKDLTTTLDTVDVLQRTRVVFIEGGQGVGAHLNTLGIHVGDCLEVVERAPFRGPVLVQINGTRLALGRGVARRVRVEEINDRTTAPEFRAKQT
jgi:Fe2+ transport system protein FeoA